MAQSVEERVQAVRILLASVNDYLPSPVTSSGLIARSAPPGPAPGKRVPCGYCRRAGRIRYHRYWARICPVCEGRGWRPRRGLRLPPSHPFYEEAWDEYTGKPVALEAVQNPGVMPRHLLDAALEQLDHDRALREGDDSSERFGWERERAHYDAKGSYRELRRSLELQRRRWPSGHRQISRVYFWGVSFQLSFDDAWLLDAAEEWIAHAMRGPVRVPPWLAEQRAKEKEASAAELAAEGLTVGQIARRLRVPKEKVRRLLAGGKGDSVSVGAAPGEPERVRA